MEEIERLLDDYGIRITAMRVLILKAIAKSGRPMSALEIERELDTVDRSTISRTLAVFSESGLLHSIHDGTQAVKYELCPSRGHHTVGDGHPHFHCRVCGRTICLTEITSPRVRLPEGYTEERIDYMITGMCPECTRRNALLEE